MLTYELRLAALEAQGFGPAGPGLRPQPAPSMSWRGPKDHLKEALVAIGSIPADNPGYFFRLKAPWSAEASPPARCGPGAAWPGRYSG